MPNERPGVPLRSTLRSYSRNTVLQCRPGTSGHRTCRHRRPSYTRSVQPGTEAVRSSESTFFPAEKSSVPSSNPASERVSASEQRREQTLSVGSGLFSSALQAHSDKATHTITGIVLRPRNPVNLPFISFRFSRPTFASGTLRPSEGHESFRQESFEDKHKKRTGHNLFSRARPVRPAERTYPAAEQKRSRNEKSAPPEIRLPARRSGEELE